MEPVEVRGMLMPKHSQCGGAMLIRRSKRYKFVSHLLLGTLSLWSALQSITFATWASGLTLPAEDLMLYSAGRSRDVSPNAAQQHLRTWRTSQLSLC